VKSAGRLRAGLYASLAALLLSCEPAVRRTLVLTFNDAGDLVTISATTTLGTAKPGTAEAAQIEEERESLLAGRDQWSMRFANADPASDRIVMQRTRGELQSLEHIASIAPENLQKFFFDTHLTVTFSRREGSAELTIYPGTSQRATRQQRERVEKLLSLYADRTARYFQAIRALYSYLDEKPRRATDMFVGVFRDDKDPPARISEEEQSLVGGVRSAIDAMMSGEAETATLDRDFDFVFNPFPAELKVMVTGEVTAVEGFTRLPDRGFLAKMPTALEAVAMLEGRWITPDPLAAAFAAPQDRPSEEIAASIADMPRHAEPVVTASDVTAALMEKMRPAPRYRVRWLTKAVPAPSQPPPLHPGSSAGGHTEQRNRETRKTPAPPGSIAALRARWW
jgi:hypothetical protein